VSLTGVSLPPTRARMAGMASMVFLHCAGTPPVVPEPPKPIATAVPTVAPPPSVPIVPAPPPPVLPPNASYEEALAIPESLDVQDERAHLTDVQLMNPVRNVPGNCRIPSRAKVTVKVAVREGRAIGVTVLVAFDVPPPSTSKAVGSTKSTNASKRAAAAAAKAAKARAKAEAESKTKTIECFDSAVRALTWPPNARRDSFTTVY
jgi:hypothetical protein